jgi:hypothetical protein
MTRPHRALAAVAGLAVSALLLSGCAAIRELVAEVPIDLPSPSLPAQEPPLEKIYQGGSRPDSISDEEWATTSKRRITAAAALHKIVVYSVDPAEDSNGLVIKIKGDPQDAQLLADVEEYVVPVALSWAPTITVIIDPSICGIVGEVRDDSPLCDALTGNG